jgi:hypothetical protein
MSKVVAYSCGDGVMTTQMAFQLSDGGSNPTSSLQNVQRVKYREAYDLVANFHYLGAKRFIGQYCFGLYIENELQGAVVYSPLSVPNSATSAFGLPRGHYPEFVEMSRLVLNPKLNGKNFGSYLIARSLRELKKSGIKAVISYADSSRHIGAVYQAANFGYYGLTPQKNDFFFADGTKLSRGKSKGFEGKWLPRSRKHRYLYLFDKSVEVIWPKESYPKAERGNSAKL